MSLTEQVAAQAPDPVHYPESDGKPMAETDIHRNATIYFIEALAERYRDQDVYVSGDILLYYVEGNPRRSVSPDVLVTFGVPAGLRRIYKTWVEGKAPDIVVEVSSLSTRREDREEKPKLYASLGIREMWLVDPLAEYLGAPFRGYTLDDGHWVEIPVTGGSARSDVLNLDFVETPGGVLLYDPAKQEIVPGPREFATRLAQQDAEIARLREELERLKAG